MDLQSGNDDIEHGGERLSAIRYVLVNHDARKPNQQRPREEENAMQGAQPQALGQSALLPILVRALQRSAVALHRLLLPRERLHRPHSSHNLQFKNPNKNQQLKKEKTESRGSDLFCDLAGLDVGFADAGDETGGDEDIDTAGDGDEGND